MSIMAAVCQDKMSTTSSSSSRRPYNVVKTEDDNTPLPNPFPLPKYFRRDVQDKLTSGEMTTETTASFLSDIASAMLCYKLYPTPDDYDSVGRCIIKKYPFMAAPIGTPYVSASHSILFLLVETLPLISAHLP